MGADVGDWDSHGGRKCAVMGDGGRWWAVHAVLGYPVWYLTAWVCVGAWMSVGKLWLIVGHCGWLWLECPLCEYGEWVQPAIPRRDKLTVTADSFYKHS